MLKGNGGGRSLILSGHVDVVPAGELSRWIYNPWSGHIDGGKIYGRGASDMKGGIIAMTMALKCIKNIGISLKGSVYLFSVTEEETGGLGILSVVERGYKADAAIIPEPTDLRICCASEGSLWFRVKVSGLTAHAGTRYYGISALDKAMALIKSLPYLEEKRNKKLTNPLYKDYKIAFPINVGVIKGGEWPSSVPSSVEFEARLGISPEEDPVLARKEVEEYIIKIAKQDPWLKNNLPQIEWFGNQCLAAQISKKHPIIHTIKEVCTEKYDKNFDIAGVPWGTDGVKLIRNAGVPTVIFGPGTMSLAHMPNEYIEVKKLIEYTKLLAISILRWCGVVGN